MEGCRGALSETEPDPTPHGVANFPVLLVRVGLVHGLGLLQAIANIGEQLIPLRHALGHGRHPRVGLLVGTDRGRIITIDDLEGCVLERRLESGIVDVLGSREPVEPLSRAITGEAAEVHDDDLISSLHLAIRLGMEHQRHVQLGAREPHELAPERRGEDGVAVRDHGLRNTMEANNLGEEHLGHRLCRVRVR